MIDIGKTIKTTVKKGKVKIGSKETKASIKKEEVKLVIFANNCPHSEVIKKISKKQKIPVYDFNSNSIDLGYALGKAYAVSVFAVLDDGGSKIMQLVKG
ncbi:MAG: 50S ribosomal protein L30e [Candidatus Thermoplasmatota archaeon]|jgi:large subunit ribosomal protein L30e|nr:50S ribosomal protein L30e [Thermoplasmatales archaeon]